MGSNLGSTSCVVLGMHPIHSEPNFKNGIFKKVEKILCSYGITMTLHAITHTVRRPQGSKYEGL